MQDLYSVLTKFLQHNPFGSMAATVIKPSGGLVERNPAKSSVSS